MARLSCRLPPRGACSPWIEVPDDVVVGASPAWEARWAAAGFAQGGRGAVALQQPGGGLVVETGTQDALQAGVELGEQTSYPVGRAGGLGREVLSEEAG